MNIFDQELFDQTAIGLHDNLKQLDKFYPNEKSLANYLEAMADKPLEEWKRFEPIKSETERGILQNISHLAALMITLQSSLYNDYVSTVGGVGELIDKVQKQEEEINRLRSHCKFFETSLIDSFESEKEIMNLMMRQRIA
jgi:hypothetical protein